MKPIARLHRHIAHILIPLLALNGCAAYRLTDQTPRFTLEHFRKATPGTCAVAPFRYVPAEADEADLMTAADLARWNDLFFEAVNRSNICGRAIRATAADRLPAAADYLIEGTVQAFYFKKNWVPMFFPVWVGLTFFTLGVYGIAAGPMNTTKVDFGFTTDLKDARTGQAIASIPQRFQSTDVMTLYSDSNNNPYGNPGLAFGPTVNDTLRRLSVSLAESGRPAAVPVAP